MNAFSFEQFDVTDANRTAFELCRDIAALRYSGPRPVLLLGPEGSGKTHLLWAIVKRVRASAVQTSLALVMAREFPDKVRDLAKDPAPIRNKPAIFLVDELERFGHTGQDLEAVVKIFLEYGHQVVIASNVHPDRLPNLSREFKNILRDGRTAEIGPRPAPGALAPGETVEDPKKQKEADLLRAALKQVKQEGDAARQEAAALRAQLDEIQKERDALEAKLAEKAGLAAELGQTRERLASVRAEHSGLQEETASLREQAAVHEAELIAAHAARLALCEADLQSAVAARDALEQQLSETLPLAERVPELEGRLKTAEEESATAFASLARLQGQVGALKIAAEQVEPLQTERDQALERLAEFQERVEALCHHVTARGDVWAASYKTIRERLAGLVESMLNGAGGADGQTMATALESAREELETLREQWRLDRESLDNELSQTMNDTDVADELYQEAQAERGRLQVALDAAQARLRAVETELEELRRQCAIQTAEMDALRYSAAGRAASASVQAGEFENRIRQLETALDIARQTGSAVGGHLDEVRGQLGGAFERLHALVEQLDVLRTSNAAASWNDDPDTAQAYLFEIAGDEEAFAPEVTDAAAMFRQVAEEALNEVAGDAPNAGK